MKKIRIYIVMLLLSTVTVSCFEENEFIIPEDFTWVGFKSSSIMVDEASGSGVSAEILISSRPLSSPVTINYTVSSDDASEGVDYNLPAGSGSTTIPAGSASVEVTLIESVINNSEIAGRRTVLFTITDAGGYTIGGPDGEYGPELTVTIAEDDFNTYGYTSFEEPEVSPLGIYNVPEAGTPEGTSLPNHPGENPVDYVSVGGELGFDLYYTEGDEGGSDDIHLGVIDITDLDDGVGAFYDGSQGYVSEDCDGELNLEFDEITLDPGMTILRVDIGFYFTTGSSFEDDDYFTAVWRTEDGDEELFEITGGYGDGGDEVFSPSGESIIGKWTTISGYPENMKTGKLVIIFRTSSGGEFVYFDKIAIVGF
ncbi:MAG: hypothetical protein JW965_04155 [Bacteroidales bacterium]|nr:hypothetical protein [Bacteroidales bacterium]